MRVLSSGTKHHFYRAYLHPDIRYIKIEDGKGRRLGRTFTVKLWPTLIFMKDGIELRRLARQFNPEDIVSALNLID